MELIQGGTKIEFKLHFFLMEFNPQAAIGRQIIDRQTIGRLCNWPTRQLVDDNWPTDIIGRQGKINF